MVQFVVVTPLWRSRCHKLINHFHNGWRVNASFCIKVGSCDTCPIPLGIWMTFNFLDHRKQYNQVIASCPLKVASISSKQFTRSLAWVICIDNVLFSSMQNHMHLAWPFLAWVRYICKTVFVPWCMIIEFILIKSYKFTMFLEIINFWIEVRLTAFWVDMLQEKFGCIDVTITPLRLV